MRGINGIIRLLLMFGPMIFNQVRRFQRSRQRQVPRTAAPRRQQRRQAQTQAPVQQQEQYEEELPSEDDFVEPINK